MIEKFLKAKHWQIFIVTFGLAFLLQLILIPMSIENNPSAVIKYMPIIMIVYIAGFLGWLWSVAIGLQVKVPANVKMRVLKFNILLFIPLIYLPILFGFIELLPFGEGEIGQNLNVTIKVILFAGIFILHILSMFGIFYSLYFVAKTFKTVELQREVSFSDFAGEFFLIWFFPIGIWVIQPKINKMIE
ncbi:MAG: hypothetical protein ACYC25_10135 [Paludibacter sp.]